MYCILSVQNCVYQWGKKYVSENGHLFQRNSYANYNRQRGIIMNWKFMQLPSLASFSSPSYNCQTGLV